MIWVKQQITWAAFLAPWISFDCWWYVYICCAISRYIQKLYGLATRWMWTSVCVLLLLFFPFHFTNSFFFPFSQRAASFQWNLSLVPQAWCCSITSNVLHVLCEIRVYRKCICAPMCARILFTDLNAWNKNSIQQKDANKREHSIARTYGINDTAASFHIF